MSRPHGGDPPATGPARTDWEAVKARLRAAGSPADGAGPTADVVDELLARRARKLAVPAEPEERAGERGDYLEVGIADSRFAIASRCVRGVFPWRRVMPLPGTPGFVLGLVHLRGEILSVLDARQLLGLPGGQLSDDGFLVLMQGGDMRFGLEVDDLAAVRELRTDEVQPTPPGSGWHGSYIAGIAPGGLVVLAADRLLSDDTLVVRQEPGPVRAWTRP